MKTLNLYIENEGWKAFEYENLSDLNKQFATRKIAICDRASIGDGHPSVAGHPSVIT